MRIMDVSPPEKEEELTVGDGEIEGVVQRVDETFTAEALKQNDGKVVPLRSRPGGPIIGNATLHWHENDQALKAAFSSEDPVIADALKGTLPNIFG